MNTLDYPTLRREHQGAERDHATWLEDVGRWQTEHRRAIAMLAQVQTALLEHEAALEAHAEMIRARELEIQRHTREIARHERGASEIDLELLPDSQHEFRVQHERAREAHLRVQTHHALVTAEIRHVFERLNAGM
ncbi:MAG: hypothetical protein GXY83_38155 [Rhodopirellula sp.]|nr:hypothetical protein [Rhodopirellula sp.]